MQMGTAWMPSRGASLPVIFPGRAEQAVATRLLSNDGVTLEPILDSHTEQTVERCGTEPLVLARSCWCGPTAVSSDRWSGPLGTPPISGIMSSSPNPWAPAPSRSRPGAVRTDAGSGWPNSPCAAGP